MLTVRNNLSIGGIVKLEIGPPLLPGAVSVVQNKSDAHNAAGGDHLRAEKYLNLLASCAQNIRG